MTRITIGSALLVWAVAAALTSAGQASTPLSGQPAGATPADRDVRWVVLIDDLHLDFIATGHIRQTLRALVEPLYLDRSLLALRTTGPSGVALAIEPSTRSDAVASALRLTTGNGLTAADVVDMLGRRRRFSELAHRARVTADTATALLSDARTGSGERLVLLLVSNGYRADESETQVWMSEIGALGVRLGVPIVPTEIALVALPRGRPDGVSDDLRRTHERWRQQSLDALAAATGGTVWRAGDTTADVAGSPDVVTWPA